MQRKKWKLIYGIIVLGGLGGFVAPNCPASQVSEADRLLALPKDSTIGQTTITVAKALVNRPYVAGTLEQPGLEQVVIRWDAFDCWTFVEQVVAMSVTKHSNGDYQQFNKLLRSLRYRNGKVNGYGSRLHYFTEWMLQAQQMGILQDLTKEMGGVKMAKTIQFMTKNPSLYPRLSDQESFETVLAAEAYLSRQTFHFIPKQSVASVERFVQDGDLIAITTTKTGLDIAHEGFAVWIKGQLHLLHASSDLKKTTLSNIPLRDYLAKHASQSGIIVARLRP
jgi:hypothetical protein